MSVAGDIITALLADITTAIAGVTTTAEAVSITDLRDEDFPHAMVLQTDYEAEELDWGQQFRTWTISGSIIQKDGTRETMQTKLEAIGVQIAADATLAGSVDRATFSSSVSHSHTDSSFIYGVWIVAAELVA